MYRYSTDEFERMDKRPPEDYGLREKPLHIRFVERYDRNEVDDPRQMTENRNKREKDTVFEKDKRYDNIPYHGDIDSQREAAHRERIDHLHQREKSRLQKNQIEIRKKG